MSFLFELIRQGEHQQLDFKFEISDSRKIAKSLVAFANTDGGRLLIGVKDNGKIAGIRSDEEFYMIEAAASMYCDPPVPFEYKTWPVSGKDVLEIIVSPQSNRRPFRVKLANGKQEAYVRVHDQNILAPRFLIRYWLRQQSPKEVKLAYTQKEKKLFDYLNDHESIRLDQLTRLVHLPNRLAEEMLLDFLMLDIIRLQISETALDFTLNKESRAFQPKD